MNAGLQAAFFLGLEATLLVAAALLLERRFRAAQSRRCILHIAFISILALTLVEFSGNARDIVRTAWPRNQVHTITPTLQHSSTPSARIVAMPSVIVQSAPTSNRALPLEPPKSIMPFASWLLAIWMAGTLIAFLRVVFARMSFLFFVRRAKPATDVFLLSEIQARARYLGIRRDVRVVELNRLKLPIAFGNTIGLPLRFTRDLSNDERTVILAHELAHIASHDTTWSLLADVSVALLWWHPMMWWLRRRLCLASETAADEASLLIENGPKVLASSLVEFGKRLQPRDAQPSFGWMSIGGFRSGLGRRVEALMTLRHVPQRTPSVIIARIVVPPAVLLITIFSTAWISLPQPLKGQNMKAPFWKRSLPAIALMAFVSNDAKAGAADPDKVGTSTNAAIESSQFRFGRRADSIKAKLNRIVLDQVVCDGLPLGEVVRVLIAESAKRDPDKVGINFLMVNGSAPARPIDPATGLPTGATEPFDVSSTTVSIRPGLKNVRLVDALDAIVRVADPPLRYTVTDYGVVFSPGPDLNLVPGDLVTETFQVQSDLFFRGIESAFGIEIPRDIARSDNTVLSLLALKVKQAEDTLRTLHEKYTDTYPEVQHAKQALETARRELAAKEDESKASAVQMSVPGRDVQQQIFSELFAQLGIKLEPPKTIFFNELTGIVMVRVNPVEMEAVRAAMETLGGTPTAKGASAPPLTKNP